ncbi:hypothetical protein NKR23_g8827 [Pleurostoma richardsiae]|uniref:SGNH hydrolase-type esterase domain-containing protein n=1 Tax=Pleurostoma richardsiae TaxID=41990 RepID=A0AA38RPI5_9PEZI|nr:hypothetical protein NKR23_g8827 [Pleurostoma richardsiae]
MNPPKPLSSLFQSLSGPTWLSSQPPADLSTSEKLDSPIIAPATEMSPPPAEAVPAATPSPPAPWPQKRTLRVLCFGDSLTAGWCPFGSHNEGNGNSRSNGGGSRAGSPSAQSYRPYAEALSARLQRAFPNLRIETTLDGLPGDHAVSMPGGRESKFRARMESHFAALTTPATAGSTKCPFDWTVVLGGTNDLLAPRGPPVEQVFEALKAVWAVPLSRGGKVLAVTVPEAGTSPAAGRGGKGGAAEKERERVRSRRAKLNEMIKGHQAKNFHVFDISTALPYASMSDTERRRYWSGDSASARHQLLLHPTAAGYDLLGEKLAAALVNISMPPGRLQQQTREGEGDGGKRAKRRKLFRDDDKMFVEEDGDDALLEHGYIVVRWKDLD